MPREGNQNLKKDDRMYGSSMKITICENATLKK